MWRNDIKCKYMFMFSLKNLARKGLMYLHRLYWMRSWLLTYCPLVTAQVKFPMSFLQNKINATKTFERKCLIPVTWLDTLHESKVGLPSHHWAKLISVSKMFSRKYGCPCTVNISNVNFTKQNIYTCRASIPNQYPSQNTGSEMSGHVSSND